jgi:hypothetical protein
MDSMLLAEYVSVRKSFSCLVFTSINPLTPSLTCLVVWLTEIRTRRSGRYFTQISVFMRGSMGGISGPAL